MNHKQIAENMRILADTFLFLHPSGDCEVDMSETKFHPCGTVACHAVWFGAACGESSFEYSFREGTRDMSAFLFPFEDRCLETFAENNPKIWGNEYGLYMFASTGSWAFGKSKYETLTLEDISNHWRGVADRYEEYYEIQQ